GDQWLVADGLAAGDRVILDGLQKIREGAEVTTVPAAGSSSAEAH
ncbi:MAG: efflux transporter periplasmic adaptor subunit, partial [Porticoccaceae bacterium]